MNRTDELTEDRELLDALERVEMRNDGDRRILEMRAQGRT
jgi:hypothetical protein